MSKVYNRARGRGASRRRSALSVLVKVLVPAVVPVAVPGAALEVLVLGLLLRVAVVDVPGQLQRLPPARTLLRLLEVSDAQALGLEEVEQVLPLAPRDATELVLRAALRGQGEVEGLGARRVR